MLRRFLQIYVSVLLLLKSLVLKNQLTPFFRRPKPFDAQLALRLQLSISVQSNEIEKQVAGPFLFCRFKAWDFDLRRYCHVCFRGCCGATSSRGHMYDTYMLSFDAFVMDVSR